MVYDNWQVREDLSLKPNQRLILVHPTEGYLPFHVESRVPFVLVYDRILATAGLTTLAAGGTIDGIQTFDSINRDELEVKTRNLLYHLFMGIAPTNMRVFIEYPKGSVQRVPDNQNFAPTAKYGYISGWMSHYDDPSPAGEMVLPWGRNTTGWRFWNPTTLAMAQPFLRFVGYTYKVSVIRNVDLVQSILEERPGAFASKKVVGGLGGFPYDAREPYDADWVPFDWDRNEIRKSLSTRVIREA